MKKFALILLAVLTVSAVGCTAKVVEESDVNTDTGATVGMANPLSDSTIAEMENEIHFSFQPDESIFTDLRVTRINTDPVTYSIDYIYEGIPYVFRIQNGTETKDISGMYFTWNESIVTQDHCEISLNAEGQGICLWQNEQYTFSIAMTEQADKTLLSEMYQLIIAAGK